MTLQSHIKRDFADIIKLKVRARLSWIIWVGSDKKGQEDEGQRRRGEHKARSE